MVAGSKDGQRHVDYALIERTANNLGGAGAYSVMQLWDEIIKLADDLHVPHDAWSHVGGMMIGGTYDATVDHFVTNAGEGKKMLGLVVEALKANANLWKASEGQNIDNFKPEFAPPYNKP